MKAWKLPLRVLAVVLGVLCCAIIAYRLYQHFHRTTDRLLAIAYTEQRILPLRMVGAEYAPLAPKQEITSSFGLPHALLDAEARIGRALQLNPEDPIALAQRGRANLLKWSYEAAITDFQQALDINPKSPEVLTDLATAYFERAEKERRFGDYGMAFELQSRALQTDPYNTVALFNRAVTAEKLFLFNQCFEDWNRYLETSSDTSWRAEATTIFVSAKSRFEVRDREVRKPLLSAVEFTEKISPETPSSWIEIEPKVEQYLEIAISDWLPKAWENERQTHNSSQEQKALNTLAIILQRDHQDAWLAKLIQSHPTQNLAHAQAALAHAIQLNNHTEDYELALREATKARELFTAGENQPGAFRAIFEEIYALHFSDLPEECGRKADQLRAKLTGRKFTWLEIQLDLEQAVCANNLGNLEDYTRLTARAQRESKRAGYPTLQLRAMGFFAESLANSGQVQNAWKLYGEGLKHFWASEVGPMPGYNIYAHADYLAEQESLWSLNVAIDRQALALISSGNEMMRAVESTRLAHAAENAGFPKLSQESLISAQNLFSTVPSTQVTTNYRLGIEIDLARIQGQLGESTPALLRLKEIRESVSKLSSHHLSKEYFRTLGELSNRSNLPQDAEQAFVTSVVLAERERLAIKSEDDRSVWTRQSSATYRSLVESKFRAGDALGSLAVWELYQGATIRSSNSFPEFNENLSGQNTQRSFETQLNGETHFLQSIFPRLSDRTVVVYSLLSNGMAIWTYDDRGLRNHWIQKDPATLRLLARHFKELCASPSSPISSIRTVAYQLFGLFVAPILHDLEAGRPLVIEIDDDLTDIPFQALVDPNGDFLVQKRSFAYIPAARYLELLPLKPAQFKADARALVVASSASGISFKQPRARMDPSIEARGVAGHFENSTLLIDKAATATSLKNLLPTASVFHFSGHAGITDTTGGLFLGSEAERESATVFDSLFLKGASISRLRLAVLSACSTETAFNNASTTSQNLVRTFLREGVANVVASRWDVDSEASTSLMLAFYDALLRGDPPSQALSTAQNQARTVRPHPYYWAAFDAFGR